MTSNNINLVPINGILPEEIDNGIFLIREFLTEEERSYLHGMALSAPEDEWEKLYKEEIIGQAIHKYGKDDAESIQRYILEKHASFWDNKVLAIEDKKLSKVLTYRAQVLFEGLYDTTSLSDFQRQYPGIALAEHHDQGHDPNLVRATVTYINDDYMNGELYFPDRNLKFRPPARSMITFPATRDYVHGVTAVGDGPTRYVITSFGWAYGSREERITGLD